MTPRDETYLGEAWAVSATIEGERVWWAGRWTSYRQLRTAWPVREAAVCVARGMHPGCRPRLVHITYWRGTW